MSVWYPMEIPVECIYKKKSLIRALAPPTIFNRNGHVTTTTFISPLYNIFVISFISNVRFIAVQILVFMSLGILDIGAQLPEMALISAVLFSTNGQQTCWGIKPD